MEVNWYYERCDQLHQAGTTFPEISARLTHFPRDHNKANSQADLTYINTVYITLVSCRNEAIAGCVTALLRAIASVLSLFSIKIIATANFSLTLDPSDPPLSVSTGRNMGGQYLTCLVTSTTYLARSIPTHIHTPSRTYVHTSKTQHFIRPIMRSHYLLSY